MGSQIIVSPPKSWEARSVPFPDVLSTPLKTLCDGKQPNDLIFQGPNGYIRRPKSQTDARRGDRDNSSWFIAALHKANIPLLTPHDLRHTAASLAISAGANVKAVQRMLGHKHASETLDTYADLFDDDLDNVAKTLNVSIIKNQNNSKVKRPQK